ncbi:Rrf2 family transcriptional regulator [Agrobacterium tumefaciens]|uniref:Rrf2 family transcriptional regulator n=1 Tax=Agrobacterium tumefaciens TaxID=358 RepID=UPI0009B5FB82
MNITCKSETAILILLLHASSIPLYRPFSVRESARILGIKQDYLRYVSKILCYRGYLIAVRGKGYQLGQAPSDISIASVLKVTQRRVSAYVKPCQVTPQSIATQLTDSIRYLTETESRNDTLSHLLSCLPNLGK